MINDWNEGTPDEVKKALHKAQQRGTIVRLILGNPGDEKRVGYKDWHEENDVVGYVGNSTGPKKVAILIEPLLDEGGQVVPDDGGGAISTDCLLRIIDVVRGIDLYRHTNYVVPELELVPYEQLLSKAADPRGARLKWMTKGRGAAFLTREGALIYVAYIQGIKPVMPYRTVAAARKDRDDDQD